MRLLVTGGAGSLGSNLIEHLASNCDAVLVLDNFATGKRASLLPQPNLEVREGSIVDTALVLDTFRQFKPTHVVHAAASYKDPNDWVTDAEVNVVGTINVIQASRETQVGRFVNLQTALCYGRPSTLPIPITHPTAPFTSYGISKVAGEAVVATSDLSWISLRLANVTGPRLAIGPIPAFYKKLKAGEPCTVSTAVRDFLDMTDFLTMMEQVLHSDHTGVFNVSTGEGHRIEEIYYLVVQHLGLTNKPPAKVVEPAADDVPAVVLDPSQTHKTFGWQAQISFEETIRGMLRWYDDHGVTDVYSHLQATK